MDKKKVKLAKKLAKEFIVASENVEEKIHEIGTTFTFFGCKETGSLRRKSMDLTRALAELRKPM